MAKCQDCGKRLKKGSESVLYYMVCKWCARLRRIRRINIL